MLDISAADALVLSGERSFYQERGGSLGERPAVVKDAYRAV
jgi:hypothetical protein